MIKITQKQIDYFNKVIKEEQENHIKKWLREDPLQFMCPACEVSDKIQENLIPKKYGICAFCPLDWGELEEFRIYNYMCEREGTLYSQYSLNEDPFITLEISKRKFMPIEKILEKAKINFKIM